MELLFFVLFLYQVRGFLTLFYLKPFKMLKRKMSPDTFFLSCMACTFFLFSLGEEESLDLHSTMRGKYQLILPQEAHLVHMSSFTRIDGNILMHGYHHHLQTGAPLVCCRFCTAHNRFLQLNFA